MKGTVGAIWGIGGIVASIVDALIRIVPLGIEAYQHPMGPAHWIVLAIWGPAMAWGEGYRGFHRSFSRMVAVRARHLRDHPRTLHVVLAPLFCLGLVHATRARRVRTASLILGIVTFILLIRTLPQPWRGVTDLGVVAGLSVGLLSMLWVSGRTLMGVPIDHPTDLPPASG